VRKFICFALAALTCASLAQDSKVTYTTVAVSAKKAIADLAQKSGMKIECSPSMEKEILVLRLNDAPIDAVMKQIAAVTSGAWNKEGETYYLVANGSARQIEANRILQRDADAMTKMLKAQITGMAKRDKNAPPEAASIFGINMGGNSALAQIALAIGTTQLASVSDGGRVVYSTNPTGMQKSLPGSATQFINQFVIDYNKLAAMQKQDEPAKADSDENTAMFMEMFGNRMRKPKPITGPPAKALVVVSRKNMFFNSGLSLELKLYDANGKVLTTSTLPLSMGGMPFGAVAAAAVEDGKAGDQTAAPAKKEEGKKVDSREIKLSTLSAELHKMDGSFGRGGGAASLKLSKDLMDALRDPVEHDPLSFVHSEGLIQIAENRNEQLVADLPDSVTSILGFLTDKGTLTTDTFLTEIKGDDKAAVVEGNGWMVVSPADGAKSRKERIDRYALRTLIQVADSKGSVGLDDVASYATKNESPMEGAPASMSYIMLFAPGAVQQGMMGQVNWDMLRFYGLLDPAQKQSLRQGTRLAFNRLTSGQEAQVTKMVFGAKESLVVETRQNRPGQPKEDPITQMIRSQMEMFGGGNENDYRTEPTEVMPSGLPQDGFIVVDFSSEPVGQPQTMSTDLGRGISLGPTELGLFKFFKDDPQMAGMSGEMPTMDDIKVGTRSIYNFSFYVAQAVCEKQTLNDDAIAKDAPVYKVGNLPADFQKRIDEMANSLKNNPMFKMISKMGGFGSKVPPPQ
jgi:hypothetical protein